MEPTLPAEEPASKRILERYPLLGDRVQSTFIDTMLLITLMFVAASVLERYEQVPDGVRIAIFVSLFALYDPVCTSLGATLGNYVKKIRVRQTNNSSKRINIFQALLRYLLKISLGWISFLTIHSNSRRRAIHDILAGSVMIRK